MAARKKFGRQKRRHYSLTIIERWASMNSDTWNLFVRFRFRPRTKLPIYERGYRWHLSRPVLITGRELMCNKGDRAQFNRMILNKAWMQLVHDEIQRK